MPRSIAPAFTLCMMLATASFPAPTYASDGNSEPPTAQTSGDCGGVGRLKAALKYAEATVKIARDALAQDRARVDSLKSQPFSATRNTKLQQAKEEVAQQTEALAKAREERDEVKRAYDKALRKCA